MNWPTRRERPGGHWRLESVSAPKRRSTATARSPASSAWPKRERRVGRVWLRPRRLAAALPAACRRAYWPSSRAANSPSRVPCRADRRAAWLRFFLPDKLRPKLPAAKTATSGNTACTNRRCRARADCRRRPRSRRLGESRRWSRRENRCRPSGTSRRRESARDAARGSS